MDLSQPIQPPSHSGRRSTDPRKHRIQITIRWGRFWLLVIFGLLLMGYLAVLRVAPPGRVNLRELTGGFLLAVVWDAALLLGIWLRHNWARILLVTRLLVTVVAFCGLLPMMVMLRPSLPNHFVVAVAGCVVFQALAACLLLTLRPIQRLSSRSFQ